MPRAAVVSDVIRVAVRDLPPAVAASLVRLPAPEPLRRDTAEKLRF
jgi:hypothetical protein